MYWEDVYEMYEYASNLNTLEKNDEMRFHYAINVGGKNQWKNLPLPYPDPQYLLEQKENKPKFARIDQKVAHVLKRDEATPERIAQRDYVKERLRQHQERVAQIDSARRYQSY